MGRYDDWNDDSEDFDYYDEDDDGEDEEKQQIVAAMHERVDGIEDKLKKFAKMHAKGLSKIESAMKKQMAATSSAPRSKVSASHDSRRRRPRTTTRY
eukprot:CAMPEP_0194202460 /NCGR_PEP_ID=MMETSP0156-20130528/2475_1 /TAXON_ID=33649 /ORGANISM="Thalassionema nitzschioides, Strain L26-B" /LENGTH=96 /DNA_ID=CAMNT_0038927953 /DNA_START=17 /DNA_END=307 /DNA_ORIENTATION=+